MHFVTELFGDTEKVPQMAVQAAPETIDDEVGEKMEQDFDAMSLFKLITDGLEESPAGQSNVKGVASIFKTKLEGNVIRNLRPAMFQMLMCKILHV